MPESQLPELEEKPLSLSHEPPLTLNQKQVVVDEIKKLDQRNPKLLLATLIKTALNHCQFPYPKHQTLSLMQSAYASIQAKPEVEKPMREAVTRYVETEEAQTAFRQFLAQPLDASNEVLWNDKFLHFIRREHNISLEVAPVVQAAIQYGKIYWRIIQGQNPVYDRRKEKGKTLFDYDKVQSWKMPIPLFLQFKAMGKRSGTVEITQQLFAVTYASKLAADVTQYYADGVIIWNLLQKNGVLNHRNRLSNGFRTTGTRYVYVDLGLTPKQYQLIEATLTDLNDKCEKQDKISIPGMPDYFIYRRERTPKMWQAGGHILNKLPKSKNNQTLKWDVSVEHDLTNHANPGDGLDHDYIPSGAVLEKLQEPLVNEIKNYESRINSYGQQYHLLVEAYNNRIRELSCNQHATRSQVNEHAQDPTIINLYQQILSTQQKLAHDQKYIEQLKTKLEEKGQWLTIAIPKALHKAGESYKATFAEQKAIAKGNEFLSNLRVYLEILSDNGLIKRFLEELVDKPEEVLDWRLKVLGAFRYLYRCQVKDQPNICDQRTMGSLPQRFFQSKQLQSEADAFFTEEIQKAVNQRGMGVK